MRIRFLFALVGLAISFALPSFAQQTNRPDPELREVLAAFNKKVVTNLIGDPLQKNQTANVPSSSQPAMRATRSSFPSETQESLSWSLSPFVETSAQRRG